MRFYLSTTADFEPSYLDPENMGPCAKLASKYGLGLEIGDFCICENLAERYEITKKLICKKQKLVSDFTMHAPYNELCPAAMDPWIREVAKRRFLQMFKETEKTGAKKLVVHTGFDPMIYCKEWFIPESVKFWKDLLKSCPEGLVLVLENVMEENPENQIEICDGVSDERFKVCLDIGHANLSPAPVTDWVISLGKRISHMHIHNNEGRRTKGLMSAKDDLHRALGDGKIDVDAVLKEVQKTNPDVTVTVETTYIAESVKWLEERGYISPKEGTAAYE